MYEGAVQDLIDELGRLPGVGPKSAQRIAFHLLATDNHEVKRLVDALTEVKLRVRFCELCAEISGVIVEVPRGSGRATTAYPTPA